MTNKAELTTAFIIEKVAPVFNKQGYSGTSMSDITNATSLTKGAVYGNFKNKNELAVQALVYNIKLVTSKIELAINTVDSSIEKLAAISNFYKAYYDFTINFGGCPILNIGIDANHQNTELLGKVNKAIINIQNSIQQIIELGISQNEIKSNIDTAAYARKIFALVEGAVFMAMTTKKAIYMSDMSESLNKLIFTELKR